MAVEGEVGTLKGRQEMAWLGLCVCGVLGVPRAVTWNGWRPRRAMATVQDRADGGGAGAGGGGKGEEDTFPRTSR